MPAGLSDLPEVASPGGRLVKAQALRDGLAKLSQEHRAVLVELYFRRSSVPETAARLGIDEATVRSRSYYALRALRGT